MEIKNNRPRRHSIRVSNARTLHLDPAGSLSEPVETFSKPVLAELFRLHGLGDVVITFESKAEETEAAEILGKTERAPSPSRKRGSKAKDGEGSDEPQPPAGGAQAGA
jgi:hypothetical protein